MIHLRINERTVKPAIVGLIADSLRCGQVVVLPTDTIYGLSCLADEVRAIKKIQCLKKRDAKKPLAVLVANQAMMKKYVFVSKWQEEVLKKIWSTGKRPTTVILKHRGRLPEILTGDSDGLAVRLPKNDFLLKILKTVKKPLVSTSLNLSGRASLQDLESLRDYFSEKSSGPDLLIDSGKKRRRLASRLVDLREGKLVVLRK